jgi:hypothetical protein
MKTSLCLALLVFGLVAGCGDSSGNAPKNPPPPTNATSSGGSVVTAPVDYLGAIANQKKSMEKTVDVTVVNQAIQQFHVELGRLPKDLDELVQEKYLARIPPAPYGTQLLYDPATGQAKVVKAP